MTLEESNALMADPIFRGRVKVAIVKYASSIQNEAATVTHHNARLRWAAGSKQQPDYVANQVTPGAVMDPVVQEMGATVEDGPLQGAVEAEVNSSWI